MPTILASQSPRVRLVAAMTALCVALGALAASTSLARGADKKAAKLAVLVPVPESSGEGGEEYERARLEQRTELAAKRVRKRLETARVKHFSVEIDKPHTLRISAHGGISEGLLAGIVVPQGHFELRPVERIGQKWTRSTNALPEGVELRQIEGSVSPNDAYLWSASRRSLHRAMASASFDGVELFSYPAANGWRTLALGESVADHGDIGEASIQEGKTGEPYVRLQFDKAISTVHVSHRKRRQWAAVLDGEVVATFTRDDESFSGNLNLTAPDHLNSEPARRAWAQQVAGRLAAPIAVQIVELDE